MKRLRTVKKVNDIDIISKSLRDGDLQKMLETLRGLTASGPHDRHDGAGASRRAIEDAIANVQGLNIVTEIDGEKDRMDAVLETDDKVYILGFTFARCPKNASDEDKRMRFDSMLSGGMA